MSVPTLENFCFFEDSKGYKKFWIPNKAYGGLSKYKKVAYKKFLKALFEKKKFLQYSPIKQSTL